MVVRLCNARHAVAVCVISLFVVAGISTTRSPLATAVGVTPASIDVLKNGSAAHSVNVGDTVTTRVTTPVGSTGVQTVEMTARWSSTTSAIASASDVTVPTGWTKTYTTDGTNYVASGAVGSWSNVIGVKAVGSVTTSGFTAPSQSFPLGLQNVSISASGDVRPTLASFQGSSAGDGWNIFHGLGNVYNFYHHGGDQGYQTGIDCHNRITSASCWGNSYILTPGQYVSGPRSAGYVDETNKRAWGFFKRTSDSNVGFLCFDLSPSGPGLCSGVGVSGFVTVSATSVGSWEGLGDMEYYAGKLWARTADSNSPVLCMVVATATPCVGQPFVPAAGYSAPSGNRESHRNRIFGGRMYLTSWNYQFDCVDLTVDVPVRCGGAWPVTTSALPAGYDFRYPIFAVTSGNGSVVNKVCVHNNYGPDNNSCFTASGVLATSVSNLPATGWFATQGWGDNFNYKDRYYYNRGDNRFGCWDFALSGGSGAACNGYSPGDLANSVYMGTPDPVDENCIWTNGDTGKIQPFNALTGALNCAPVGPTVDFKAATFVPRLPCAAEGTVRQWDTLTVFPPDVSLATGVTPANAKLTVLVGGVSALASWTNVAVSSSTTTSATFDLSGLSVGDSGISPTFAVSWVAGGIAGTTGELRFKADPAQLCVDLTVDSPCPTGNGQSATAGLPGVDLVVSGTSKIGAGSVTSMSSTTTAADNTTCLGAVTGTLSASGQPLVGVAVTLMPGNASPIQVTTSAQGTYTIPRLFPATYPLVFGVVNGKGPNPIPGTVAIPKNQTVTKNGTYDTNALQAPDIARTVNVNNGAIFSVTTSAGTGIFDPTRTRLVSPTTGATVSAITMLGQPTWSLDTNGDPQASAMGTVGTYYAIYQAETSGGSTAQGLLTLIVTNPPQPAASGPGFVVPPRSTPPSTAVPTTAAPTTATPTTRAPSPPVTITVAPGAQGSLPQVPAGQSLVVENGKTVDATIQKVGESTWQMTGRGFEWQMQIPSLGEQPGSDKGVVTLVTDRSVEISGFGFKEESLVDLWLFSTPVYIGTVRVDKNGNFVDELKVPSGIPPGFHTLQANGVTPDNVIRSLNLGVQVIPPKTRLPVTGSNSTPLLEYAMWFVVSGVLIDAVRRRRLLSIRR